MTDWESRYLAEDTPWDKGTHAPPLDEVLTSIAPSEWGDGPILVPGCGSGHDVRRLARLGVPVIGLDISRSALKRAESYPLVGQEVYEAGDFLAPSWSEGRVFSGWWEHTCFCAIDPSDRDNYVNAAAACLSPGALFAGVFFLTPYDPGEDSTGPPFESSVEEIMGLFQQSFDFVEGWVPSSSYPGREGREWVGIFRRKS